MASILKKFKNLVLGRGAGTAGGGEVYRAACRTQYHYFKLLLSANKKALEIMTDIEQALTGDRVFGMSFIRANCTAITVNVYQIIKNLDGMHPGRYAALFDRFEAVRQAINDVLAPEVSDGGGELILGIEDMDKSAADVAGSKMANLGEVVNHVGLPVPPGFVVTTAGFRTFMAHEGLAEEINRLLLASSVEDMDERFQLSSALQQKIIQAPVPRDLEQAVMEAFDRLCEQTGREVHVSMRSSALGEDSAGASFAGQFRTELNVSRDNIFAAYKNVVASMYGLSALSYRLNRGIRDEDAAMAVGCMVMADARSSGVIYSRSPVHIRDDAVIINSVWGLPKPVVDGAGATDLFVVARRGQMAIRERRVAQKGQRMVCHPGEGVCRIEGIDQGADQPSLSDEEAVRLAEMAVRLEEYYGVPQDVEWALEADGALNILQCRPLMQVDAARRADLEGIEAGGGKRFGTPILAEGDTASPGVGAGLVHVVENEADSLQFKPGSVLVVRQALPKWASLLNWASALVAEEGSLTGHLANVAREFRVPAIMGAQGALAALEQGREVTVDADGRRVYPGKVEELVERGASALHLMAGSRVHTVLTRVAEHITPLNLLDPDSLDFRAQNCRTLHDITRYCHERSVHEMFNVTMEGDGDCGKRLWIGVATQFWVVDLDDGFIREPDNKFVELDNIASIPMLSLWEGIVAVPWQGPPRVDSKGFMSIIMEATTNPALNTAVPTKYDNRNYFLISKNFCNLQSRFGFHFSTVEAFVGDRPRQNYADFRFKGGAADMSRRRLRAEFIASILSEVGFAVDVKGDSMGAKFSGREEGPMRSRLKILGYLTMHTRQLDMIMADRASAREYRDKLLADINTIVAPEMADE